MNVKIAKSMVRESFKESGAILSKDSKDRTWGGNGHFLVRAEYAPQFTSRETLAVWW